MKHQFEGNKAPAFGGGGGGGKRMRPPNLRMAEKGSGSCSVCNHFSDGACTKHGGYKVTEAQVCDDFEGRTPVKPAAKPGAKPGSKVPQALREQEA